MNIPIPYFENVPKYGDLVMEQIIVEYVYPLLSVLKDGLNNRYLCMCFDTRGAQQWLVAPISKKNLIALLRNRITLAVPFSENEDEIIAVTRNYDTRIESFSIMLSKEIPEENLPQKGEYLDSEDGEWDAYILSLAEESEPWVEVEKANVCYSSLILRSAGLFFSNLSKYPSNKGFHEVSREAISEYSQGIICPVCL